MHSPVLVGHTRTVFSPDGDAITAESCDTIADSTTSVRPSSFLMLSPSLPCQIWSNESENVDNGELRNVCCRIFIVLYNHEPLVYRSGFGNLRPALSWQMEKYLSCIRGRDGGSIATPLVVFVGITIVGDATDDQARDGV